MTPKIVPRIPIREPQSIKIFVIEFLFSPIVRKIPISFALFFTSITKPETIFNGLEYIKYKHNITNCPVVLMSPQGKLLKQNIAKNFVKNQNIIIISGRYEGVDERVVSNLITHEISIGDYVLSGGELPTAIFIEVLSRMAPGVLGNEDSLNEESFSKSKIKYQ